MYSTKRSFTIDDDDFELADDDDDLEPKLAICRQSSAAADLSRDRGWARVLFVIIVFIANTAYSGLRAMPF